MNVRCLEYENAKKMSFILLKEKISEYKLVFIKKNILKINKNIFRKVSKYQKSLKCIDVLKIPNSNSKLSIYYCNFTAQTILDYEYQNFTDF